MNHFAGGNGRIFKKLKDIYDRSKKYCIYYDYSPENYALIEGYRHLSKKIRDIPDYNNNVMLVPIPCMEYMILKMLQTRKYIQNDERVNKATVDFDYDYLRRKYPACKSLETMLKHILNDYLSNEYHNINVYEESLEEAKRTKDREHDKEGIFYLEGNLSKKAEELS